jgi:hypothetical protein
MAGAVSKSFETPDELRTPPRASVAVVDLNGSKVARATFEPGWRWSESVKPIAGTETCQVRHVGVLVSGNLRVAGADGVEYELGPGTAYIIEPGHDAWVAGETPVVGYEFDSAAAASYATPPS